MAQRRVTEPTVPPLGNVLDFMHLMWRIYHLLQGTSKRMESSLGITAPQRLALRIIGRFPGIPSGRLAEIMQLHPSTMTGIVQRLASRRLVSRRRDPLDSRRVLLGLTASGRALDRETPGTVESAIALALGAASAPQIDATRSVLRSIAESLSGQMPD